IALLSSPVALTVNFSGLTSSLTLSLMDCASSMMSLRLTAVIFTLALNGTFGVGTSSVEGSSVGVMNFRTILFFRVMLSFLFASSIRLEMAPIKFLNNRASFIVALNKAGFEVPSFLLVVSANELSNIGLTILSPGCPAVGASEELRGRLVGAPSLDEPIKGFVVVAFWTLSLRLGEGANLLLLFA